MPLVQLHPETSVLVVVDVQPAFLNGIWEADRVLARTEFLVRVANTLEVPVLATEQYQVRMGKTHESLAPLIGEAGILGKMSFSCSGCDEFVQALESSGRRQVVIVGIETHICVSLTAQDLLKANYQVVVCPDAVSARTQDRHKIGMERIRDAGAVPAHSESVAYEWMRSADHPKFREVLSIVKSSNA